ncbi:ABC transporter ATP-binding protein [Acidovorax sp. CCYZU-2555]|uniref:ABC transporter ATP-binding protein n=1 Tax=Acidovorax sp. CCYZU-2555 TaxID=2835042 RepID=UPI001BCA7E28|nr:ABC transporter ATP-binding protein [Acidovorax sp. CCYZU-2555]MBS7776619.1 ABC transporter ATP-binding protein [Acidovorax sp. CCYZU-2555]
MTLLVAHQLVKRFGALLATDHVSFAVNAGEIHALIGPNGAGKSTLVNLISGLLPADGGTLSLDGVDLTHLAPHRRVAAGLSRCFQVTSIFPQQTVGENLLLAVQAHAGSSFRFARRRETDHDLLAAAQALAERVTLAGEWSRVAGTLPHGAQRKLDVALAIAAAPKLLLLDEPMAGMGPVESAEMVELIQRLRQDMAILLIEHDMDAVFQLADRISVLVYGKVLTSGTAAEIQADAQVQAVYLGTEEEVGA